MVFVTCFTPFAIALAFCDGLVVWGLCLFVYSGVRLGVVPIRPLARLGWGVRAGGWCFALGVLRLGLVWFGAGDGKGWVWAVGGEVIWESCLGAVLLVRVF